MTDWWPLIEDYCLKGDLIGLLVAADGLQEQGDESMAGAIRWAVKRDRRPIKVQQFSSNSYWYMGHPHPRLGDDWTIENTDLKLCWEAFRDKLEEERAYFA